MKKIVFLGCENSHSTMFMSYMRRNEKYKDIEIVGVYSNIEQSMQNVSKNYNVPMLSSFDEAVGKVDGVVITSRHGDLHFKYAKPYIQEGVTIFIDKPITINEEEAVAFMKECKQRGAKITGGSCLRFEEWVKELASDNENEENGKTIGGFVRCPISLGNVNGGFFFYAQHLVETVQVAFGSDIKSVYAKLSGKTLQVLFHYDNYTVCGTYADECYKSYYVARLTDTAVKAKEFALESASPCFKAGFEEFFDILYGAEQKTTYQKFILPVFIMNAIYRSMQSGKEEVVKEYEV